MALLERVSTLLRANLNDLVEKAEDPERLLKQIVLDMENQLLEPAGGALGRQGPEVSLGGTGPAANKSGNASNGQELYEHTGSPAPEARD